MDRQGFGPWQPGSSLFALANVSLIRGLDSMLDGLFALISLHKMTKEIFASFAGELYSELHKFSASCLRKEQNKNMKENYIFFYWGTVVPFHRTGTASYYK